MKDQPNRYGDDDGRVIVNMDVEGMRWHREIPWREGSAPMNSAPGEMMTPSEARQYTWYSILAALSIGFVFSITWVAFILFCTKVWFR